MGSGFAARAQDGSDQQGTEPGAVLQRGDCFPGVPSQRCGQHGWVVLVGREAGLPSCQARLFVPVGIKDQRVARGVRHEGGRRGAVPVLGRAWPLPSPLR